MAIYLCGPNCTTENKNNGGGCGDRVESYVGAVLCTWERNGHDDSDFYALVWDAETSSCKAVEYASTRGWTYHNGAHVDASESVQQVARESLREKARAYFLANEAERLAVVSIGDTVRSTTTRGKYVGVEGIVKWIGIDGYKSSNMFTVRRFGVKIDGVEGLRYLSETSVEKTNTPEIDVEFLNARADEWILYSGWRTLAQF
jgi:hypothetical protein